jgi:hypothetical protein
MSPATTAAGLALALVPLLASGELQPRPLSALPADLQLLARDLQDHGFTVRIALPPVRQSYGLFQSASRTLWLSPLSFELGIARPTFLHEATHAVQSCPTGRLTPIGWRFPLAPVVEREISGILTTRYHHGNRILEQEAFGLQGQPDAVPRLRRALAQRCPRHPAPAPRPLSPSS